MLSKMFKKNWNCQKHAFFFISNIYAKYSRNTDNIKYSIIYNSKNKPRIILH